MATQTKTQTQSQNYTYSPLQVPPTADPAAFKDFGRKVDGFNPDTMDERGMAEIIDMLYRVSPAFLTNHGRDVLLIRYDSTRSCCSPASSCPPNNSTR